ncbi:MAG: peptidase, partial [Erysipelotrichaceae bacterium]|nr:peptidase [Erysipelotrichaceae bacterium]
LYEAQARGISMIRDANPSKEYLTIKSLEAYEKMADGKATKIIVPSELQGMASLLTSAKTLLSDKDIAKNIDQNLENLKR